VLVERVVLLPVLLVLREFSLSVFLVMLLAALVCRLQVALLEPAITSVVLALKVPVAMPTVQVLKMVVLVL
jgi:hypothetical protein